MVQEKESKARDKLLSDAYLGLGTEMLKQTNDPQIERYEAARKIFEESVKLNPKNKAAKDFYRMLLKLEQSKQIQSPESHEPVDATDNSEEE